LGFVAGEIKPKRGLRSGLLEAKAPAVLTWLEPALPGPSPDSSAAPPDRDRRGAAEQNLIGFGLIAGFSVNVLKLHRNLNAAAMAASAPIGIMRGAQNARVEKFIKM
jgi:hypothetical protein